MSSIPPSFFEPWTTARAPQLSVVLQPVDLCAPLLLPMSTMTMRKPTSNYYRQWRPVTARDDYGTTLMFDKQKFEATLDVQQYAPNEIKVKVAEHNSIIVEGKHEEKQDQHGYVARQFLRRYMVPEGHAMENVVSSLSSDGILTITAPRLEELEEQRSIPVLQTGVASTHAATLASISVEVTAPATAASVAEVKAPTDPASTDAPEIPNPNLAKEEKQDDEKKD